MDQAWRLRNMIQQQQTTKDHVAKVITITSGKGGVGKSNVSVNLAIQLSKLGKKVIILDADFGFANVEVMLGIRPKYSLYDLMFHNKTLEEIIVSGPENISFISGGSGIRELTTLTTEQVNYLNEKLYELDESYDYIIIDTGAGMGESVIQFATSSTKTILVVTPEPTSITDAYAVLKTLNHQEEFVNQGKKISMLTNRVSSYENGKELYQKLNMVVSKFLQIEMEYLGPINEDPNISKSVIQQKPISLAYPNSSATISMKRIAQALEDGAVTIPEQRYGLRQVFSNLIRSKRK